MKHKPFLTALFKQAVAAADPGAAIAASLPPLPIGRTVVVGAGKAVLPMYRCLQEVWQGSLEGILVTGESQGMQRDNITILKGSHPLPDAHGLAASRQIQDLVASLTDQDLVIALVSGGGSAMLPAPAGELTLEDEIAVNQALLASGAPISAMNTVRKHISTIKGGRLAASTQARVHTLVVSDIPGDVASQVASGPTLPDASTRQDAMDIIARYSLELPEQVMRHIKNPLADAPIPGDPVFERNTYALVASGRLSLQAALRHAEEQGINATLIADDLQGEASEVGRSHAVLTREIRSKSLSVSAPMVLLSGGETTVTMRGKGRGGRNTEFLLSWAIGVEGMPSVTALAADTDGRDGSENNAGAFADGTTVQRLRGLGLDAERLLDQNDSYSAFDALGDLFLTGPTGTNVNDFRAVIIE